MGYILVISEIVGPLLEYSFQGISRQGRGITFGGVTIRLLFPSFAKTTPSKSRGTAALSAVFDLSGDRSGDMLVTVLVTRHHSSPIISRMVTFGDNVTRNVTKELQYSLTV